MDFFICCLVVAIPFAVTAAPTVEERQLSTSDLNSLIRQATSNVFNRVGSSLSNAFTPLHFDPLPAMAPLNLVSNNANSSGAVSRQLVDGGITIEAPDPVVTNLTLNGTDLAASNATGPLLITNVTIPTGNNSPFSAATTPTIAPAHGENAGNASFTLTPSPDVVISVDNHSASGLSTENRTLEQSLLPVGAMAGPNLLSHLSISPEAMLANNFSRAELKASNDGGRSSLTLTSNNITAPDSPAANLGTTTSVELLANNLSSPVPPSETVIEVATPFPSAAGGDIGSANVRISNFGDLPTESTSFERNGTVDGAALQNGTFAGELASVEPTAEAVADNTTLGPMLAVMNLTRDSNGSANWNATPNVQSTSSAEIGEIPTATAAVPASMDVVAPTVSEALNIPDSTTPPFPGAIAGSQSNLSVVQTGVSTTLPLTRTAQNILMATNITGNATPAPFAELSGNLAATTVAPKLFSGETVDTTSVGDATLNAIPTTDTTTFSESNLDGDLTSTSPTEETSQELESSVSVSTQSAAFTAASASAQTEVTLSTESGAVLSGDQTNTTTEMNSAENFTTSFIVAPVETSFSSQITSENTEAPGEGSASLLLDATSVSSTPDQSKLSVNNSDSNNLFGSTLPLTAVSQTTPVSEVVTPTSNNTKDTANTSLTQVAGTINTVTAAIREEPEVTAPAEGEAISDATTPAQTTGAERDLVQESLGVSSTPIDEVSTTLPPRNFSKIESSTTADLSWETSELPLHTEETTDQFNTENSTSLTVPELVDLLENSTTESLLESNVSATMSGTATISNATTTATNETVMPPAGSVGVRNTTSEFSNITGNATSIDRLRSPETGRNETNSEKNRPLLVVSIPSGNTSSSNSTHENMSQGPHDQEDSTSVLSTVATSSPAVTTQNWAENSTIENSGIEGENGSISSIEAVDPPRSDLSGSSFIAEDNSVLAGSVSETPDDVSPQHIRSFPVLPGFDHAADDGVPARRNVLIMSGRKNWKEPLYSAYSLLHPQNGSENFKGKENVTSNLLPAASDVETRVTEDFTQNLLLEEPSTTVSEPSSQTKYVARNLADEKKFWSIVQSMRVPRRRIQLAYPILKAIPLTTFSCRDVAQPGYYADRESGCQAFHRCDIYGSHTAYLCSEQTLFNQLTLVCDHSYNVDCEKQMEYADYINSRAYDFKRYSRHNDPSGQLAARMGTVFLRLNDNNELFNITGKNNPLMNSRSILVMTKPTQSMDRAAPTNSPLGNVQSGTDVVPSPNSTAPSFAVSSSPSSSPKPDVTLPIVVGIEEP